MRKTIAIILLLILFLVVNTKFSFSANAITYFYLDAIKIENNNIEIISDEIIIDTTTSKVENTILLKNTSEQEIETDIIIPLENEELSISIKDLIIRLNDVQVDYVRNDNGEYFVKTKISANSGKKVNIEYLTENDLMKAKIIKCNFDNLKGREVSKLKVDVKIDEKNIPLIEKIYPGHYTFKDNMISVEYYNYTVNTITKDVIVKKETFNNLLYGRETELTNKERKIISNWYEQKEDNIKYEEVYNYEDPINNKVAKNIIDYKYIKTGKKFNHHEPESELLYNMVTALEGYEMDLKDKIVCIDYVETEEGKDLYINKTIDITYNEYGEVIQTDLIRETERKILKTNGAGTSYAGKRGARIIYINEGIDGEFLNATEEEKVSYINQINADMYIRIEIYDGIIKYKTNKYETQQRLGKGMVGYYDDKNSEIVKAFALTEYDKLKTEESYTNSWHSDYEIFYSNYEEYSKNYYKDYYKDCTIKLSNDDITNKCKVPTVVQFVGNRVEKDGKYVVEFFDDGTGFYNASPRGLSTTNAALQTTQAKNMLAANRKQNSNVKTEAENKINSLNIIDDEVKIQQEIKEKQRQEELERKAAEEALKASERKTLNLENKDIIVFSAIGVGIVICLIILIIEHKRKNKVKKENNNGKETNKD